MLPARIAILIDHPDRFNDVPYFLRAIADIWQERGHTVIIRKPADPFEPADLAILHADVTHTPPACLAMASKYPRAMNTGVLDISKRRISRNLVSRDDTYAGPVIVKTDLNFGGTMEDLRAARGSWLSRTARRLRRRLPWAWRNQINTGDYRVFESKTQVPRAAWANRALVVERFLPERRDGCFCLRTWVFLGTAETNSLSYSEHPVIKSERVVRRESLSEVPDELRAIRRELCFDFGKFDYVIIDGRPVLFDANRTPTLNAADIATLRPRLELLADGLHSIVEPAATHAGAAP